MNKKIIKSILKRKFNKWAASIKNENVKKLVYENTIITGGSIPSLLLKENVNDFDIYFRNKETVIAVANYYVDWFKELHKDSPHNDKISESKVYEDNDRIRIMIRSAGIVGENTNQSQYSYFEGRPIEEGEEYLEISLQDNLENADELDGTKIEDDKKVEYRPVFLTDNAITLSNKIQIIIRFYGEPDEIHKNYDFIHCTNYWESKDNELILRQPALESLLAKQLYYVGSKYPVCSIIRIRKFLKRGWHINAGQILKICLQISELDLKDVNVLEDQLTGVDTAYFTQMINWIKEKQEAEKDFNLDMPYLISLIDKLF